MEQMASGCGVREGGLIAPFVPGRPAGLHSHHLLLFFAGAGQVPHHKVLRHGGASQTVTLRTLCGIGSWATWGWLGEKYFSRQWRWKHLRNAPPQNVFQWDGQEHVQAKVFVQKKCSWV